MGSGYQERCGLWTTESAPIGPGRKRECMDTDGASMMGNLPQFSSTCFCFLCNYKLRLSNEITGEKGAIEGARSKFSRKMTEYRGRAMQ